MKKKIAIYGDSYANGIPYPVFPGWPNLLKDKYDVNNFGHSGTNLYFSYKEFLKNHFIYDQIIIVVTHPGRIEIPKRSLHKTHQKTRFQYIANVDNAQQLYDEIKKYTAFRHTTTNALKAVVDYYMYIQNDESDDDIHQLLLDEIKKIRPDTVLIPAFRTSFPKIGYLDIALVDITKKEEQAWGFDNLPMNQKYHDKRACHMTNENNKIFSLLVDRWLQGAPVELDLLDFVTPPSDGYIEKRRKLL